MGIFRIFLSRFIKGPPIKDPDSIGFCTPMTNGKITKIIFNIVARKHLDASMETISLLETKLKNITEYIKTEGFIDQFAKDKSPEDINIKLICIDKPDEGVIAYLQSAAPDVLQAGATLTWKISWF